MKAKIDSAKINVGEPDRATVHANGIVVDVIANDDSTVYVEVYAYDGRAYQAVVESPFIDRYRDRHPNIRVRLAENSSRERATKDG